MFVLEGILDQHGEVRVDEKEEVQGLDIAEHGTRAYGDFRVN